MSHIALNGLHDGGRELFAQLLAFDVDIAVGTSAEIDAFKAASRRLLRCQYLFQMTLAAFADDERLAGLQFLDVLSLKVEGGLNNGSL